MQLKQKNLRAMLGAATATLLGHASASAAAEWEVNSSIAAYEEQDGVKSISPMLQINRQFADQRKLSVNLAYDSLSGASPTGASGAAQTVTSPSGKPVQLPAGDGLIYAPFEDERKAVNLAWEGRISERTLYSLGGAYSKEVDFSASSISAQLNRAFLKNNLSLALGTAFEKDLIEPVGGAPKAFALNGGSNVKDSDQERTQVEGLVSATLTLSPKTLAYFALGYSRLTGYLTDPYKVITVVDPDSGQPIDGQAFDSQLGPNERKANLYEKRPDERTRQSFFSEIKQAIGRDAFTLNYRYTQDDWEIDSHTLESRYRWTLSDRWYIEPSVRWYRQSAAYFYRHSLVNYQDISGSVINVRYASADRRLAEFDAYTAGLRISWLPSPLHELSLRGSVYRQQGESHPDNAIGAQKNIDFFPDHTAYWLQLLYRRQW